MRVRIHRRALTAGIFALVLLGAAGPMTPVQADTGIVRAVVTKGGFIVGVGGGTGTLAADIR